MADFVLNSAIVRLGIWRSKDDCLVPHRLATTRTDPEAPLPYRQNKRVLFNQWKGSCNRCRSEFPFRVFEVDHIGLHRAGGQDNIANLQLLDAYCSRAKRARTQEYLLAGLRELRIVARTTTQMTFPRWTHK